MEAHDAVGAISSLIGTWRGEGAGHYPTIDDFTYREEITFWHSGRPWLGYLQKTWDPTTDAGMHSEGGYWRPQPDGRLEVVISHAFGIVEVLEGTVDGARIELESASIVGTSTAKEVPRTARNFEVDGDVLRYDVSMAYGGHPVTHHLSARLERVAQSS